MNRGTRRHATHRRLPVRLRLVLALGLVATVVTLLSLPGADRPGLGPDSTEQAAKARHAAVSRVLEQRAAALLARDRDGFLATIDPEADTYRRAQEKVFDNLSAVPFESWEYRIAGTAEGLRVPQQRIERSGTQVFGTEVELRYRLAGFDTTPVTVKEQLNFTVRAGSWYLAGDGAGNGRKSGAQLWDLGKVNVVRGRSSLVMGLGVPAALRGYADEADRAVPAVTAIWGDDWSRRVVVMVPASEAQMASLLGQTPEAYRQIAAVTTGELGARADAAAADRVVINPDAFRELGPIGRRVVMVHEVTHVATRAVTKPWTPTWLAEGVADYSGYLGSGVSLKTAAAGLYRELAAGRIPTALPHDDAFATTREDLARQYELGWLACRLIAEKYGQDQLVAFYRRVGSERGGGASGTGDRAVSRGVVEAAFRDVLGTTVTAFTEEWRAYLRSLGS